MTVTTTITITCWRVDYVSIKLRANLSNRLDTAAIMRSTQMCANSLEISVSMDTEVRACYRLNTCVPSKFVCWNLTPSVMVFGGEVFGRQSGHEGGAPMNGISALKQEIPESSLTSSTMWGHSEKMVSVNQESGSHHIPDLLAPWSWTSSLQNCEK